MNESRLPDYFQSAADMRATARLCLRGANIERAIVIAEAVRKLYPDDPDTHCLWAEVELARNGPQKAQAVIEDGLCNYPHHAGFHRVHGDIHAACGRIDKAETAYREVLRLEPAHAVANVRLAVIEKNRGRLAEARRLLKTAADSDPDNAEAWSELADTVRRQGEPEAAARYAETALQHDPANVVALEVMARTSLAAGKARDALDYYNRLIALRPAESAFHTLKAGVLSETGDVYSALQVVQTAIQLDPDNADALRMLAVILVGLGRWDDPEVAWALDRTLELRPGNVETLAIRADILHKRGDYEGAFRIVEQGCNPQAKTVNIRQLAIYLRLASRFNRVDEARSLLENMLHNAHTLPAPQLSVVMFNAGEFYDRLGEYDRAFECFEKANTLKPRVYNGRQVEIVVDRAIKLFTRETVSTLASGTLRARTPVFVVGMPRSGTSLAEKVLACHPDVVGAGELGTIEQIANTLNTRLNTRTVYPECLLELDAKTLDEIAQEYLDSADEMTGRSSDFVVDKLPANAFYIGLIRMIFPHAPIVHCKRNPMDVALSCYTKQFTASGLNFSFDLSSTGHYYRQYERIMDHWEALFPGKIHTLQYETLVTEPGRTIPDLLEFCGLSWDPACLQPHMSKHSSTTASFDQTRQPLYTKSIDRWKHYEKYLEPFRRALES